MLYRRGNIQQSLLRACLSHGQRGEAAFCRAFALELLFFDHRRGSCHRKRARGRPRLGTLRLGLGAGAGAHLRRNGGGGHGRGVKRHKKNATDGCRLRFLIIDLTIQARLVAFFREASERGRQAFFRWNQGFPCVHPP